MLEFKALDKSTHIHTTNLYSCISEKRYCFYIIPPFSAVDGVRHNMIVRLPMHNCSGGSKGGGGRRNRRAPTPLKLD